jgi:hypothetical protein
MQRGHTRFDAFRDSIPRIVCLIDWSLIMHCAERGQKPSLGDKVMAQPGLEDMIVHRIRDSKI